MAESPSQERNSTPAKREDRLFSAGWYQALTLTERLEMTRSSDSTVEHDETYNAELTERKLKRWKEQYPFEKDHIFAQRLELDKLSEEHMRFLWNESPEALQARLADTPAWLQELRHAYAQDASSDYDDVLSRILQSATGAPAASSAQQTGPGFLTVALPLIISGIERLRAGIARFASTSAVLPFDQGSIYSVWLTCLPGRLIPQIMRTLTLELNVARLEDRLHGDTPQERARDFTHQLRQREVVLPLLEEYAPLARNLVTTIEHWVLCGLEFLDRLCADWEQICQTFSLDTDPGQLVEINGSAGDLHKGGQSTLVLRFSSGFRLIYRPKPMAVDVHFQELLRWLNEHGEHPAFRTLTVLDRGLYGWAEFAAAEPCTSQAAVERFYERQGGYLALFYALEATDVHFENLIAAGEDPVMIDLESLFHPRPERTPSPAVQQQTLMLMDHSVLRIGLLPHRMWGDQEHRGVDISGLGGEGGQLTPRPVLRLEQADTDQMHFIRERVKMPSKLNRPTLNGESIDVNAYKGSLLKGFEQIYRLLTRERDALLSGPIQAFANDEIRLIVRATNTYAQLLMESYHPDLLRNALDRDCFFDRLWGATTTQPSLKRLIAAERADLHAGDIPLFTTRPDTRDIFTSRGVCIADYLPTTSLDNVKQRFQSFSEQDLQRQLWFIEASLETLSLSEGASRWRPTLSQPVQGGRATSARLLKAACDAGEYLAEMALGDEKEVGWIGLTFVGEREWALLPAGADLYNGATGIALFLAYLGTITGEERYTKLARAALASLQLQVAEMRKDERSLTPGGFDGWGGLLYLYTHLGALWHEPALWEQAREIIPSLRASIDQDNALDMISGAAGLLTTLLAFYHVVPSPDVLEMAIYCGDHLLRHAAQCGGEPRHEVEGKPSIAASHPLTGFSHGAAGMAFSLLQLAAVSGEARFREGARRAMEYERSMFLPEQKNWPDFRTNEVVTDRRRAQSTEGESCLTTWCHGAPGIGLGRLASLPYQDDPTMREEIAIAIQSTIDHGFGMNHSICHGDLGNLEIFLTAAQTWGDVVYHDLTQTYATMALNDIERQGWLTGTPSSVKSPGLMTGIAGIGYQLLRLAYPERVPNVLILAPPTNVERKTSI